MASHEEPMHRWTLLVRPVGTDEPWHTLIVSATSVVQAEAIARRMPLEVWAHSPSLAEAKGHARFLQPATMPLLCEQCRYPLDGLVISRSQTECPECGCSQLLFNCHQVSETKWFNSGCAMFAVLGLAIIGGIVVTLVLTVILASNL